MVVYMVKQQEERSNAIEKALLILLAFRDDQSCWGVRELSAHLGFSPATVLRIFQILKTHDFVTQDIQTKKYHLGNVYFSFFQALQQTHPVNQAMLSYLERLRERTQETVHFNIIQGNERVCINSLESRRLLKGSMPIGERSPLYAGASSKCLLAFTETVAANEYLAGIELLPITENTILNKTQLRQELEDIKTLGYASSIGERSPGLGSLSAPVRNYKKELMGCISLAIPEMRFKDYDHRKFCIEALLEVTASASESMGYRGLKD
jgi:IclR family transcriptional regulator, KDG regulon repressor